MSKPTAKQILDNAKATLAGVKSYQDAILNEAKEKAAEIIKQAEFDARNTIDTAEKHANRLVDHAQSTLNRAKHEADQIALKKTKKIEAQDTRHSIGSLILNNKTIEFFYIAEKDILTITINKEFIEHVAIGNQKTIAKLIDVK